MTGSSLICQIINNLSASMDIILLVVKRKILFQSHFFSLSILVIFIKQFNTAHFADDANFFIQVSQ